jgi:hypothetical protein
MLSLPPSLASFLLTLYLLLSSCRMQSTAWRTTALPNPWYWAGNEPDLLAPWLFNFARGAATRTQFWTRWLMDHVYTTQGGGASACLVRCCCVRSLGSCCCGCSCRLRRVCCCVCRGCCFRCIRWCLVFLAASFAVPLSVVAATATASVTTAADDAAAFISELRADGGRRGGGFVLSYRQCECTNVFYSAGVPGNDDFGTMSAWFVFGALGFYPLPGTTQYILGCVGG